MAGILKNQLVKRLASFTKGLSVDKINLDILSGRGYLDNLELDEDFMTHVLELPPWINLTKILCSKIRLKVSFTKLKSEAIKIIIENVYVEADICKSKKRAEMNIQQKLHEAGIPTSGSTSYGYIEQVIDGMHITVRDIRLTISSRHHYITIELLSVELLSTNSKWKPDDLRRTRAYIMPAREEVLVYKMLTVNSAKFEFIEKTSDSAIPSLRFNFNMISLLITMKKLVASNEVTSACLKLILDDILLVFTPSQLQVLLAISKELTDVIELSAPSTCTGNFNQSNHPSHPPNQSKSFMQRFSKQHQEEDDDMDGELVTDNVQETSYHVKTGTIDILLCDDETSKTEGSLQYRFEVVQLELYPHRTACASRRHWNIPHQYIKDAQQFANARITDFMENTGVTARLESWYEMVVVLRCGYYELSPVMMANSKRPRTGPILYSDKTKFGISETEPAMVVTLSTYYSENSSEIVPPNSVYIHVNPTEVNLDEPTAWWLKEFVAATMTTDFKEMLIELAKEDYVSEYSVEITVILPHVMIPLNTTQLPQGFTSQISGLQLWFSKIKLSNLNNSTYLPFLTFLQEYYESSLFNQDQGFPMAPTDRSLNLNLKNKKLLPHIIEELCKKEQLQQILLEEKLRQRSGTGNVRPQHNMERSSTNSSPDSTPSRRSSVSSISMPTWSDALPNSEILRSLPELLPELHRNVFLALTLESFSADFIYTAESGSSETYRSRRFISDVPLKAWFLQTEDDMLFLKPANTDNKTSPDITCNGHPRLRRNLKRQSTLTSEPVLENIFLLKAMRPVTATLDREQYLFILRLQNQLQVFLRDIILSVTQLFTAAAPESSQFSFYGNFDHVMADILLPEPKGTPSVSNDVESLPDTSSSCLSSHISSPNLCSRHGSTTDVEGMHLLIEKARNLQEESKLNWVVMSRSDSNLTALSERYSVQSDEVSLSSITSDLNPIATGDSKETLLKFLMRVNKKCETKSVGCQTSGNEDIVASTYQELHQQHAKAVPCFSPLLLRTPQRPQTPTKIQVHGGGLSVLAQSLRDVSVNIICSKVLVFDKPENFENRPKHFPFSKWQDRAKCPQVLARFDMIEPFESNRNKPDYLYSSEAVVSDLTISLFDKTLDSLTLFIEPDPLLPPIPIEFYCNLRNVNFNLKFLQNDKMQRIHLPWLKVKLNRDESVEVGEIEFGNRCGLENSNPKFVIAPPEDSCSVTSNSHTDIPVFDSEVEDLRRELERVIEENMVLRERISRLSRAR